MTATQSGGAGIDSGGQDITSIRNGVNGIMATVGWTNDTALYRGIAFVDDGSTTNGTPVGSSVAGVDNGSAGRSGEVMNYPLSPVSNAPQKWPFGVPREEREAVIINVQVTRDREYVPTEMIYLDTQDPYQVLSGKQGAIASRMLRAPDWNFRDLINANGVVPGYFDGLSFFHTAHLVSPGSTVTWSNDVTCTQAEWDSGEGMSILLDALASIPWFDGQLKDGSMSKPVLLTARQHVAFKARQLGGFITNLTGPPIVPQAVNAAGVGSGHSAFNGMIRDVINFQDLYQPTLYADSGKYIYAIATMGGAVQPAFILSPKRFPQMNLYGVNNGDEFRRKHGAIGWDWDGYWGVGFGLPQCAVRMKIG
jgi:hypothetical protein